MEIRRLTPEEQIQRRGLSQTVFFHEREDIRKMLKAPQEHIKDEDAVSWGAFSEGGASRLESALKVIPYNMRMNGHDVKMAGIASVATRPEARGKGHVRRIMEKAFPAMLEAGQTFSFLYPFSYEYYRKLGYEMCHAYHKVTIPPEQAAFYPFPDGMEPYEPGEPFSPFEEVYGTFIQSRNLAILRKEAEWQNLLERDPYKDFKFTYLHRDSQGKADAYILYNAEDKGSDGNGLKIEELCWATPEGLKCIFGFLGKLGAEYSSIEWNAPCDVDVHALFPNAYDLTWKVASVGMLRLVDVNGALATLRAPEGSGRVNIGVSDKSLPGNSGIYSIQWESGSLAIQKEEGGKNNEPHLETTAETLAQLVTGYLSPLQASYKKDTLLQGRLPELMTLFPKQHIYIKEQF